ncbi:hypothetical protein Mal4_15510 [Maioricimonas rarisocia]|uniref:Uncharacterized protein n=1 Tax=Maioricimonas rarisocia TaxID=2528026 RepID=A0A517Z450_9PLAN|nr:hypothetical protein [Maioricimonas rarisocia]QDU37241.1 hypothetical protein Mal4_15510 [Maioricimonas rarisocia]
MQRLSQKDLIDFVETHAVHFHALDLDGFRTWLSRRIEESLRQPYFAQQCRIRELKREHRRRLRDRERRLEKAADAYAQVPAREQIEQLEHKLDSLGQGVAGLTKAVAEGRAEPEKLAEFEGRFEEATGQYRQLVASTPERKRLDRARASLERLRDEIGLTDAETELEALGRRQGKSSTASGTHFETVSSSATHQLFLPELVREGDQAHVLHGVTLGCARGELDQVVVVRRAENVPVEVRAIVEAKRNINDLAHGFRQRQENLAWFAGDASGYDPALYRTDRYPEGHFQGPVTHEEEGQTFLFDTSSFESITKDAESGWRLDHLCFVTERRPLLGVGMAEHGQILNRVATDPAFNIDSKAVLGRYRKWAQRMVEPMQTEDVLALYARRDDWARQIVFA